jgi:Fe-S-cluster containining protein
MKFNCTGCGECCRHIDNLYNNKPKPLWLQKLIASFPYTHINGVCEKLVDGKCSVYEDRPVLCRVDQVFDYQNKFTSRTKFYNHEYKDCEGLIRSAGLSLDYLPSHKKKK